MTDPQVTAQQAAADAALALELVARFFANQVDAGAVLREEMAQHIRAAADRVAHDHPQVSHHVELRAVRMIGDLPEGWASGDDWQEPA